MGQLRAEAAIEPLFALFELTDEWHEWVIEELPEVYGMIGPAALPALTVYLADRKHTEWPRVIAALSVEKVGKASPLARSASIEILSKQLESFEESEGDLNAALVESLVNLEAKEAAPQIERAIKANAVEMYESEDWEEIQEQFGLLSPEELEQIKQRREAEDLQIQQNFEKRMQRLSSEPPLSFRVVEPSEAYWRQTPRTPAEKKAKLKKKESKQTRKKNRKR